MKRLFTFGLAFLVAISLIGCESKEEKAQKQLELEQQKIQTQFDDFKEQAIEYEKKADFDNAIALYEKALDLKENSEIRNKLNDIKNEQESIEKAKSFLTTIEDMKYEIDSVTDMVELSQLLMDHKKAFDEFESIDTTKDTDISNFVKETLNSTEYKNFKSYYDKEEIKEAALKARTSVSLDKLSGGMDFQTLDYIVYDSFKSIISMYLESLPTKLPAIYR